MPRAKAVFAGLIIVQAAHSIEESVGRLWESFPPAAFLTSLVGSDREGAFIVLNCALVTFGLWCLVWPVRQDWRSAKPLAWFWVVLETINGIGHSAWSIWQGAYTPGLLTAPMLLVLALYLGSLLRGSARSQPAGA